MNKLDLRKEHLEYFKDDFYGDFYDFFLNFLKFKELTGELKPAQKLILFLNLNRATGSYTYKLVFDQQLNLIVNESEAVISIDQLANSFAYSNHHDQIKFFNRQLAAIFDEYDLDKDKIAYKLT